MTRRLVILGASGNSADIAAMVHAVNAAAGETVWETVGILDDRATGTAFGLPILGRLTDAASIVDAWFVNGIGSTNNYWRRDKILASAGIAADRFATIVHPGAQVFDSAAVDAGSVLYPGVIVGAGTRLERHVLVLANSVINHGCVIGEHACLASGVVLSGNVRVGRLSYLGAAANVLPKLSVGARALVGAGAVVTRDVADDAVVAGVPARLLRTRRRAKEA